jgi:hypothetical protein
MSPHLLTAGFLQIGNPFFYNYDPVCFDTKSPRIEKRSFSWITKRFFSAVK